MSVITIFGSSRPRPGEPEYEIARTLGKLLALSGFEICNGAYGGTMEASALGAQEAGGTAIGVVAEFFSLKSNPYISRTFTTKTLIDRLIKLIELGDAYVVLKGSTGTLLEFSAIWEFINKRVMPEKPIILLGSFWSPIMKTLQDELAHEGLKDVTGFVSRADSPQECVDLLRKKVSP